MKPFGKPLYFLLFAFFLFAATDMQAQLLKKLGKKAERAAERTIERRVERETEEKTDAALDSILEPGQEAPRAPETGGPSPDAGTSENPNSSDSSTPSGRAAVKGPKTLKIYTNYDFVPGDKLLLYDDFSVDNVGDFPAKWNTNGAGEVVKLNESADKWMKLSNNTVYVPDLPQILPEDYTLEWDMITTGLDRNTSSVARLQLVLDDNNTLRQGRSYAEMSIPLAQYVDAGIYVNNYFNGENTVRNYIKKDVRHDVTGMAHIAVAVNGPRFRVWLNERKLVDLPRFIAVGVPKYIKFDLKGMPGETNEQFVFMANVKLAAGGEDLRSKLLKEGRFSTTGILFDSGSANIKPESWGTLKNIADALQQESAMNIRIVGHTDADGSDTSNLELSKKRAAAVRDALAGEFDVQASRLQTDGKGEGEPLGDNNSTEGKARNRRVEFIKI